MVGPVNMAGQKFGRLLVTTQATSTPGGTARWNCVCDCGNTRVVIGQSLRNGSTRSCGCLSRDVTSEYFGKDLSGQVLGRWTVKWLSTTRVREVRRWWCVCECGVEKLVPAPALLSGKSQSCGCLNRERSSQAHQKHGLSGTAEHKAWAALFERCYNPKCNGYANYGGRGIVVSARWMRFENFFRDMGSKPSAEHSIERIDTDGNYEKSNCTWATKVQQVRNRRLTLVVENDGVALPLGEWAERLGTPYATLYQRFRLGSFGTYVSGGLSGGIY